MVATVHRNRAKLARRAHYVATALERRGIRATYRLHDSLLSNRHSRRHYERERPALDDVQTRVLDSLEREGYAVLPFAELFPDDALRAAVEEELDGFAGRTEEALEREAAGDADPALRRREGKEFVVRLWSYDVELTDEPWLRASLSHRLLDVANAYLRMWSKLEYVDAWYSVPEPADAERRASQRWHRDYNDRRLLKAFLYVVDVDEGTGPFEYVPGSTGGGPYSGEWPWEPLGTNYPPHDELVARVPESAIRTFTAPRGTLILCDTSGFHRGGFATERPRVLATVTYSSPASLASLTERNFRFTGDPDALDAPQRFAVS
jgi:hypothetical protein